MRCFQNLPLPPRIPPPHLNNYVRHSHNLPLPPRIYPPTQQLCATFPESTPSSQNIPPFQQLYVTFPKSTSPSQNKHPFSTNILLCDASRIYPPSQNTPPPISTTMCDPPSQNLPLPPRIYPLFNNYMWPSQSLPLPSRVNAPSQQIYYYAMLRESTPFSQNTPPPHFNNYVRHSQNLPLPPRMHQTPISAGVKSGNLPPPRLYPGRLWAPQNLPRGRSCNIHSG